MSDVQLPFRPDTGLIGLFIKWIEGFDQQHAKSWAFLYREDPEAAMCEATWWGVLTDCGVEVRPNRDLTGERSSPDFLCLKGGARFYVEATCIHIETVVKYTHLRPGTHSGSYTRLTQAIWEECGDKARQCANLDAPCLVAIGTFHNPASTLCIRRRALEDVLTGQTGIGMKIDVERGGAVSDPYPITTLQSAAFFRPGSGQPLEFRRYPISGLLLGGFGVKPPTVCALLHPEAVREFDPTLLDRIPFGQLRVDEAEAKMWVEWTDGQND